MRCLLNIFSTGTTVSSFGILRLCKRIVRNNPPEVFLGKYVLEKCSKFTGENTCRSVISIKLLCKFIKITLPHGCSPVNILHIFRTFFPKNTSGGLLLHRDHSNFSQVTSGFNADTSNS